MGNGEEAREQGEREKSFPLCPPHPAPVPLFNAQCSMPNPKLHITELGENYVIKSNSQKCKYRH